MRLLPAVRRLRYWINMLVNPTLRRQEQTRRREFAEFVRRHGSALGCRLTADGWAEKRALVVGGFSQTVRTELGLIKGLEMAGFTPSVLTPPDPWLMRHYELAGVERLFWWDDFLSRPHVPSTGTISTDLSSLEDLLAIEHEGVRVGTFTASTALRRFRVGSLDFESAKIRGRLSQLVAASKTYVSAAQALIQEVKPQLVLFIDRGYTPEGELFDVCLANEIDVVTWNAAHKSNAIMIKRYTRENRDEHPASLSTDSWEIVRNMEWTKTHRDMVQRELQGCYVSGDWYSEVGTQFHTRVVDPQEVRRRLALDKGRKTAVLFPHILWDGTFFYGQDLFGSYEAWFVETVRVAFANSGVNWLIKVHPGNVVKNVRDGVQGEPSEIRVIREQIGQIPDHVRIIPPESDISTFSLFGLMDYCVTVRGTVGIEAASFGVPVLTAGTGRYDDKGFTVDSASREQYLEKIARIHEIPSLTTEQQELAERFAFGVFLLRPLLLKTVTLEYQRDARATPKAAINALKKDDWLNAPDLKAFAEWVADGKRTDFLNADAMSSSRE